MALLFLNFNPHMKTPDVNVVLPDMQPADFHTSIETLMLDKFIDCDISGNLNALTISGMPTSEQLAMAWIDIQQEYIDALGSGEQTMHLTLNKQCAELAADYQLVDCAVKILGIAHSPELVERLNEILHRSFEFNPENMEDYRRDLGLCMSLRKRMRIELHQKNEALQALQKANSGEKQSKRSTRAGYTKILIVIGDHVGIHLRSSEMTTLEFCERIKQYNSFAEAQKTKPTKNAVS